MTVDDLLSRLEKVKQTAQGDWVARCPSHDDRSPSLSVKDSGDGRILVHCFAGCEVTAVLAMVGLKLSDLMPESRIGPVEGLKRLPFNPRTVLEAIGFNATAVAIAANAIAYGKRVSPKDADTLADMAREIHEALAYAKR